jgi:hypothetical protein
MGNKKYLWLILIIFGLFSFRALAEDTKGENNMRMTKTGGEDSPFGVLEFLHWNHSWNNYKYPDAKSLKKAISLMKEAGIAWVRMDFLWDEIEPKKGEFEFKKYDAIVDLLVKNGIKILGILDYSANWASSCGQWNCPPADNKVFANYAVEVARHYRDRVLHWEVWNEPDSRTYWLKQDGLKSYCQLLKEVYLALKEAVPECKVLNGGLANGISSLNNLYDNGAKDYFDILNIHIFESPINPGAVKAAGAYPKAACKIMSRNGDAEKKIWITEIGCPGVKKDLRVKNWWLGENPSELRQAEWVKKIYAELLKNPAVEKIFWAFFRDTQEHWDNGIDYFGLVRWDFSKKPAFGAYKKAVKAKIYP